MIKDLVVNLAVGSASDVATDFAASMAATFDAHLTGIAFVYEPIIPAVDMYGIPPDLIESQRIENEKAAQAALARFEEAARRAAISAEPRRLDATLGGAADVFAPTAPMLSGLAL